MNDEQSALESFSGAEDALAAAVRLDRRGSWEAATALFRAIADRWPEHRPYCLAMERDIGLKRALAEPVPPAPGETRQAQRRAAGRLYLFGGLASVLVGSFPLVVPWIKDPPLPPRFANPQESLADTRQWASDMDRIVAAVSRSSAASERWETLVDSRADLASRSTADPEGRSALAALEAEIAAAWEERTLASRNVQELLQAKRTEREAREQADREAVERRRRVWFLNNLWWGLPLILSGFLALLRAERMRRRDMVHCRVDSSRAR